MLLRRPAAQRVTRRETSPEPASSRSPVRRRRQRRLRAISSGTTGTDDELESCLAHPCSQSPVFTGSRYAVSPLPCAGAAVPAAGEPFEDSAESSFPFSQSSVMPQSASQSQQSVVGTTVAAAASQPLELRRRFTCVLPGCGGTALLPEYKTDSLLGLCAKCNNVAEFVSGDVVASSLPVDDITCTFRACERCTRPFKREPVLVSAFLHLIHPPDWCFEVCPYCNAVVKDSPLYKGRLPPPRTEDDLALDVAKLGAGHKPFDHHTDFEDAMAEAVFRARQCMTKRESFTCVLLQMVRDWPKTPLQFQRMLDEPAIRDATDPVLWKALFMPTNLAHLETARAAATAAGYSFRLC